MGAEPEARRQAAMEGMNQLIFRPMAERLLALVPPQGVERMLDAGCGTGVVAEAALERFPALERVHGMDLNAAAVAVAQARAERRGDARLSYEQGELPELPGSGYQLIAAQQVLHQLADPRPSLRAMAAGLAPGGWLAVAVWPTLDQCPVYDFLYQASGVRRDKEATFGWPLEELRRRVLATGLEVQRAETLSWMLPELTAAELSARYYAGHSRHGAEPPSRWPRAPAAVLRRFFGTTDPQARRALQVSTNVLLARRVS